ncbi:MAG: glycosyltransferase family 4 protein [candidate division KSB1 bacterium]|nr:glycosyltransferase family 4 protein [candidate division KSB1 bacterium]
MKASAGKRVLIIVQNLPVPLDRRVWLEATTLQREGYRVSVISPRERGEPTHTVLEGVALYRYWVPTGAHGVVSYFLEFLYCWLATAVLSVAVALKEGFDVIHACNPPDTYFALAALYKLGGKRFVFDHHDLSPEMFRAKFPQGHGVLHKILLLLERMTFRTADVVLATNESHKEIAMVRGRVPEGNVYVVRSGPDFARLRLMPAEPALKEGRRYLVAYLGEMCPQDGVDYLLRAAHLLRMEMGMSDVLFVIMGGGPALPALRTLAKSLELDGMVRFTGRVSDLDLCRYLSTADLCVDPDPKTEWSDRSTMNKILEYMAFGKPIVAFDLKEHRRSAGDAAVYARANDERDFALKVRSLLLNRKLRERMGRIGYRRVVERLSWEHSSPNLLRAYRHVFAGMHPPADAKEGDRGFSRSK